MNCPETSLLRLISAFTASLRLQRGLSENTVMAYTRDLRHLAEFLPPATDPGEISRMTLHEFMASLHDLGLAPASQARMVASLRSFFHYLRSEGIISADPARLLETPKTGRPLPEVLSVEEIDAMVDAIPSGKEESVRNRAIIEMLYGSGLRVSELCDLRLSRMSIADKLVIVDGKGAKQRMVPLSDVAMECILAYLPRRSELPVKPGEEDMLFLNRRGVRLTRVMVFYIIRDLAAAAGIGKKVSPHTLRHSFATHLLEGGANLRAIQQMLGHESIATTEIYLHLDASALRRELLAHHPLYARNVGEASTTPQP